MHHSVDTTPNKYTEMPKLQPRTQPLHPNFMTHIDAQDENINGDAKTFLPDKTPLFPSTNYQIF